MAKPRVLVVDDEPSIRRTLRDLLEMQDYEVDEAPEGAAAIEKVKSGGYDAVLLDLSMPGMDGMTALREIRTLTPETPVIMLTGTGTIDNAVEATRLGAFDFLQKPPQLNRLLVTLRNALERGKLATENRRITARVKRSSGAVPPMLGESAPMRRIKELIERAAPSEARILVTGEAGTGKELVAQWVHHLSNRSEGPMVAVNCAAIPADLIESELFGHEKGAFTGATQQQIGTLEQADGGTLFLDEVGDMSLSAQAKVLRALQESRIRRVGGQRDIAVDVRVVAATNKDLEKAVEDGEFREDLYHRLSVVRLHLSPLRERSGDIPALANLFCAQLSAASGQERTLSEDALRRLASYPWRGNVRELRNAVERLLVLTVGETITEEDVEALVQPGRTKRDSLRALIDSNETITDFRDAAEKHFLERKLDQFDWNVSKTAEMIDLQRSNVYARIKRWGIERP